MKRKFEKLLSLILAMAMCLSLVQVTAFAATYKPEKVSAKVSTFTSDKATLTLTSEAAEDDAKAETATYTITVTDSKKANVKPTVKVTDKDGKDVTGETLTLNGNTFTVKTTETAGTCKGAGTAATVAIEVVDSATKTTVKNEWTGATPADVFEGGKFNVDTTNAVGNCTATGSIVKTPVCDVCGDEDTSKNVTETTEALGHITGKTVYTTIDAKELTITRADGKTAVNVGDEVKDDDVITVKDKTKDATYQTRVKCDRTGCNKDGWAEDAKTVTIKATEMESEGDNSYVSYKDEKNVVLDKNGNVVLDKDGNATLVDDTKAGSYTLVNSTGKEIPVTVPATHGTKTTTTYTELKNAVEVKDKDGKVTGVKSNNCKVDGSYVETVTCDSCGKKISETTKTIPAAGDHIKGEAKLVVTSKPTCTTEGAAEYQVKCSVCGTVMETVAADKLTDTQKAAIKAATKKLDHKAYTTKDADKYDSTWYTTTAVKPVVTEEHNVKVDEKTGKYVATKCDGELKAANDSAYYVSTTYCGGCGTEVLKQVKNKVTPLDDKAKADTYVAEWAVDKDGKLTGALKVYPICAVGGEKLNTVTVSKADVESAEVAVPATASDKPVDAKPYTKDIKDTSNKVIATITVNAVKTEATCGKDAYTTYTAVVTKTNADNTTTELAKAEGEYVAPGDKKATNEHTYGEAKNVTIKEATETEEGIFQLVKTCTVCGHENVLATGTIAKLEKEEEPTEPEHVHAYGEAVKVVIKEATETETGVYELVKTCECGDKVVVATGTIAMLEKEEEPAPAKTSIKNAVVKQTKTVKYTGNLQNIPFTVTVDGKVLTANVDYTVAAKASGAQGAQFTGVGNHAVVIKGIGEYEGNLTATLKIAKASQTIKVTPVSKTLKVNKKKAQKVTLKTTGAKTAVTYTSNNKKVTVSKAGVVTVAKGFKGTAKITVKAASNKNYNAANTVTVTIKVK